MRVFTAKIEVELTYEIEADSFEEADKKLDEAIAALESEPYEIPHARIHIMSVSVEDV